MQRRYNLAHFILANIVALGLSLLIVEVEVQARIAFESQRDGKRRNLRDGPPMGRINDASLKITMVTPRPHGLPTVSALLSSLRGMETEKST